MPKEYKTKLESGEMLSFRVSRKHRLAFTNYCDENGLNESAVLRIMLINYLRVKGVEVDGQEA